MPKVRRLRGRLSGEAYESRIPGTNSGDGMPSRYFPLRPMRSRKGVSGAESQFSESVADLAGFVVCPLFTRIN